MNHQWLKKRGEKKFQEQLFKVCKAASSAGAVSSAGTPPGAVAAQSIGFAKLVSEPDLLPILPAAGLALPVAVPTAVPVAQMPFPPKQPAVVEVDPEAGEAALARAQGAGVKFEVKAEEGAGPGRAPPWGCRSAGKAHSSRSGPSRRCRSGAR